VTLAVALIGVTGAIFLHNQPARTPQRQTVIQVTAGGFIPATLAVKAGTQVVWQNLDSAPHAVASNPYPENSSVPGLNSRTILPSGSYTFTPTTSGKIEYHDNTQPTLGGIIMVER
jgi:plastocyanin